MAVQSGNEGLRRTAGRTDGGHEAMSRILRTGALAQPFLRQRCAAAILRY
jgi:hypothetical protein